MSQEITIVINGTEQKVMKEEFSFIEIVKLAFPNLPGGENAVFTVTYRRGHGNKEGTLVEGQSIKTKDGMIFNVSATDQS